MSHEARGYLSRQFETAWALASFHLEGLTTEECLWRPAAQGLHVAQDADGVWRADWPDRESYDLGPPSIAWTTWHMGYWWTSALAAAAGDEPPAHPAIIWPGDADGVRAWLGGLRAAWSDLIATQDDASLRATDQTRWPFQDRPFADVVAWANVELTKNAAEIGYARFLYGVREVVA